MADRKLKPVKEEKTIYGVGGVDEGNWFHAQMTGNKGESWGTLDMPLKFLPSALAKRALKGQNIHVRIVVADDGEDPHVFQAAPGIGRFSYREPVPNDEDKV